MGRRARRPGSGRRFFGHGGYDPRHGDLIRLPLHFYKFPAAELPGARPGPTLYRLASEHAMEIAALTWSTPLARLAPVPPRTPAALPSHDWPHAAPSVRPHGAAGPAAAPVNLLRDLHAQARMARAVAAYQAEQAARQTAARSPCAAQDLGDIDCLMVLQAYRVAMPNAPVQDLQGMPPAAQRGSPAVGPITQIGPIDQQIRR
ncbi:hypothetical protein F7890_10255 [Bordetella bronchiseptica]|nr:hypothetical protein F7D00_10255 [Bordetella bronchiseptica]KAB1574612.1 hypothetical protein F7890_10255 [Bordetella bronchiseptica]